MSSWRCWLGVGLAAGGMLLFASYASAGVKRALPNGLGILVDPDQDSDCVAIAILLACPVEEEPVGQTGIRALLAGCLVGGPRGNPFGPPDLFWDEHVWACGGTLSYTAGWRYVEIAVRTYRTQTERVLDFLVGAAANPALDSAALTRARQELGDRQARESSMERGYAMVRAAFTGAPAPVPVPYGQPDDLQRITETDLRELALRALRPERMLISVTGNVDADWVISRVSKQLGEWRPASPPPPPKRAVSGWSGREVVAEQDGSQRIAWLNLGYSTSGATAKEHAALEVLAAWLTGRRGKALNTLPDSMDDYPFRVGLALAPGNGQVYELPVLTGAYPLSTAGLWYMQGDECLTLRAPANPLVLQDAYQAVLETVEEVKTDKPGNVELERVKARYAYSVATEWQSRLRRAESAMLAALFRLDGTDGPSRLSQIRRVTAADISAAADKFLVNARLGVTIPTLPAQAYYFRIQRPANG